MENIRDKNIKNITFQLINKYLNELMLGDFQHNKLKVSELAKLKGKFFLNHISGYAKRQTSPPKNHRG